MARVIADRLYACEDCAVAIASGDYSGMGEKQAGRTRAGLARLEGYAAPGDDQGFMWRACDVCGAPAGDRHEFALLG
jgi:hypothetical protein